MEYNDEQLIFTKDIEKMANEYTQNLKSYGFVFLKTENVLDDERLTELNSQVLYVLKMLKRITISKKSYAKFDEMEKFFYNKDRIARVNKSNIKIKNYCDGLKLLISLLCDMIKTQSSTNNNYVLELTEIIKDCVNLFGDCKYRLMLK